MVSGDHISHLVTTPNIHAKDFLKPVGTNTNLSIEGDKITAQKELPDF